MAAITTPSLLEYDAIRVAHLDCWNAAVTLNLWNIFPSAYRKWSTEGPLRFWYFSFSFSSDSSHRCDWRPPTVSIVLHFTVMEPNVLLGTVSAAILFCALPWCTPVSALVAGLLTTRLPCVGGGGDHVIGATLSLLSTHKRTNDVVQSR